MAPDSRAIGHAVEIIFKRFLSAAVHLLIFLFFLHVATFLQFALQTPSNSRNFELPLFQDPGWRSQEVGNSENQIPPESRFPK